MKNKHNIESLLWEVYQTISHLAPEEYSLLLKNKGMLKFHKSSNTYEIEKFSSQIKKEYHS
ncbi:hypothetical protein SH2C18_17800 [Clostridium sediminicola]|uniref:hypothetical protein n=1 Tax=Clostridium sediminicola TaxID=3114879 RepID=UPI0031F25BCA